MNIQQGDLVHYHPIIGREHDGKTYTVRAVGELSGGQQVAWLTGKAGCVALAALSPAAAPALPEGG